MDTTTQAGLVLALLAMLLVLLGSITHRRRRERAQAEAAEPTDPMTADDLLVADEVEAAPLAEDSPVEAEPVEVEPVEVEPVEVEVVEVAEEPVVGAEPEQPVAADEVDEVDEQLDEQLEELVDEQAAEAVPTRTRRRLWRRRSKDRKSVTAQLPEVSATPEGMAAPGAGDAVELAEPTGAPAPVETLEQLELRTLREQLRALEQVVQEQVGEPPSAALARVEEAAAVQSAAYLRQVSLVVQGLAAHAPQEEDPQRTLARVAAAVERLGVPNAMERPVLPVTTQPPARRGPSHLREAPELAAGSSDDAPRDDAPADVFSNLDVAGREFRPVPDGELEEVAALEPAGPVPASMVGSIAPVATGAGPVDEPAYPATEGADTMPFAPDDARSLEETDVVLPVPPPSVIPLEPRRRGRRRTST